MFIAAWCGAAAWTAEVNLATAPGPRGCEKQIFPPPCWWSSCLWLARA